MEKTLESIFIQQYEDLKNKLKEAHQEIERLKVKGKEIDEQNAEVPILIKTISKEVCYLKVEQEYNFDEFEELKKLTSQEVQEIIDSREKLIEYSKLKSTKSWYYEILSISKSTYPYTANILGETILINVLNNKKAEVYSYVMNKGKPTVNEYFDISRKDELYEYGLDLFKERLIKYKQRKIKEEEKNE